MRLAAHMCPKSVFVSRPFVAGMPRGQAISEDNTRRTQMLHRSRQRDGRSLVRARAPRTAVGIGTDGDGDGGGGVEVSVAPSDPPFDLAGGETAAAPPISLPTPSVRAEGDPPAASPGGDGMGFQGVSVGTSGPDAKEPEGLERGVPEQRLSAGSEAPVSAEEGYLGRPFPQPPPGRVDGPGSMGQEAGDSLDPDLGPTASAPSSGHRPRQAVPPARANPVSSVFSVMPQPPSWSPSPGPCLEDPASHGAENPALDNLFRVFLVFQEMRSRGVRPDLRAYNALVNTCADVGELDRALEVVRQMVDEDQGGGLQPDAVTYTSLIKAAARATPPRVEEAEEVG